MQLEILRAKQFWALMAIPAGAVALAGCGPNYSGNGNEFVVQGKVTHPGHHSLKTRIFEIDIAEGGADGWFDDGKVHQIHDNCNCHGILLSNKKYGVVYNLHGTEISPSDVAVGACVRFEGKIRSNHEGKLDRDRPVYDVAQIETCPPNASNIIDGNS